MNIDRIIARQVKLGYLIACGAGSYRVNREKFMFEMERRCYKTKLGTVGCVEYEGRLVELGVIVV